MFVRRKLHFKDGFLYRDRDKFPSIITVLVLYTCILTFSIKNEKRKQLLYITIMIIISHTNTKLLHIK